MARKAAGLQPVRLNAALSRGCQLHAQYLKLNAKSPAGNGLAVHHEDANLPGTTPEDAGGQKSVIAAVLNPQTCVEDWMATLYHRIPILTPNLGAGQGFGRADRRAEMGVRTRHGKWPDGTMKMGRSVMRWHRELDRNRCPGLRRVGRHGSGRLGTTYCLRNSQSCVSTISRTTRTSILI